MPNEINDLYFSQTHGQYISYGEMTPEHIENAIKQQEEYRNSNFDKYDVAILTNLKAEQLRRQDPVGEGLKKYEAFEKEFFASLKEQDDEFNERLSKEMASDIKPEKKIIELPIEDEELKAPATISDLSTTEIKVSDADATINLLRKFLLRVTEQKELITPELKTQLAPLLTLPEKQEAPIIGTPLIEAFNATFNIPISTRFKRMLGWLAKYNVRTVEELSTLSVADFMAIHGSTPLWLLDFTTIMEKHNVTWAKSSRLLQTETHIDASLTIGGVTENHVFLREIEQAAIFNKPSQQSYNWAPDVVEEMKAIFNKVKDRINFAINIEAQALVYICGYNDEQVENIISWLPRSNVFKEKLTNRVISLRDIYNDYFRSLAQG